MTKRRTLCCRAVLCALLVCGAAALHTPDASACGGLFCANAQPGIPPAPVDQTAEVIVFEVGDGTITANVQIQYTGDADDFAWVVPAPTVPVVAEADPDMIQNLEASTSFNLIPPSVPVCDGAAFPTSADDSTDCSPGCAEADSASGNSQNEGTPRVEDGVRVFSEDVTANYEYAVIQADNAADLVGWLQTNAYNVSDNMIPVMQPYADGGMVFVGFKLREGRTASDIVPISMTYEAVKPMIPLMMTAVAAQPLMGVLVFIVGQTGYAAENYSNLGPAEDELSIDENYRTNYFEWVARAAAERDGKAFVIEYLGAHPQRSGSQVTRFYTRMNPEHMTTDPVFSTHPDPTFRRSNTLDLSSHPPVVCNDFTGNFPALDENLPSECAFNYCGEGGTCVVIEDNPHCICPAGRLAQTITGPTGDPTVTCVPAENPYGITDAAGGVGTEFDPCIGVVCGAGSCVVKAGFPTCACDDGTAARPVDGVVSCVSTPAAIETFGPGAGVESRGVLSTHAAPPEPTEDTTRLGPFVPLAFLGLGLMLARRRRES